MYLIYLGIIRWNGGSSVQHFDLLCSCDCKFDERLCCLGWLLVVHTGNLNINPCSPVCIFLICRVWKNSSFRYCKVLWLKLLILTRLQQRWISELEVHLRHGKSGLPGISPSMQAVLFKRNSWLACLSSWKHPSLLSGELHIVALCWTTSRLMRSFPEVIFQSMLDIYM